MGMSVFFVVCLFICLGAGWLLVGWLVSGLVGCAVSWSVGDLLVFSPSKKNQFTTFHLKPVGEKKRPRLQWEKIENPNGGGWMKTMAASRRDTHPHSGTPTHLAKLEALRRAFASILLSRHSRHTIPSTP